MRKKLTNNLGLKIISFLFAVLLWIVVVNVDDPVVSRTYSGIAVEVVNGEAITGQGKTYEILDGSDTISVRVFAKRSVIEKMSKDYIKATADMKELNPASAVTIDVRSTRFSDRIESLNPVTKNLKVKIEDLQRKQINIAITTDGEPMRDYIIGTVTPAVNVLTISGPDSLVSRITTALAVVDVSNMSTKISTNVPVRLYDGNGDIVNDNMLKSSVTDVHVDVDILKTKEIPITASISGRPAEGYQFTNEIEVNPQSIVIAGIGTVFDNLEAINIPGEDVLITGATEDVIKSLKAERFLPKGIVLKEADYDGVITVRAGIGKMERTVVDIPTANIKIENIPEGYAAALVDIGGSKRIEIQGLPNVLAEFDPTTISASIDASAMIPREASEDGSIHQGSYDGQVRFAFPDGISETEAAYMEVILNNSTGAINLPVIEIVGGE